ncbi:MAG: hypothetical protein VB126_08610 [Paludibacter sp.]|nr:hypothetical protein [Paludibacter sp.]
MKFKYAVLTTIVLFSLNIKAQNIFYFEFEDRITLGKIENRPKITLFGEHLKEGKSIGTFFYGQTNNKWSETYCGFYYKPFKWVGFYGGIGVETDSIPFRVAFGNTMKYEKISFSQWYEYGGSGFWYSIALNYRIKNQFKAGLLSKRYYGTGINVTYSFKDTPVSISNAFLYDFEFKKARDLITLRFSY